MWPFKHTNDNLRHSLIRDAARRTRALEDAQPTTKNEATLRDAERRTDELEERAEQVAGKLRRRVMVNHFAEGLGLAWGQNLHHGKGG